MGFGSVLKTLLSEKNMSIKDLSEVTGISLNTLYSITKRDSVNVRQETLTKIADALNVSTDYLLNNNTPKDFYFKQTVALTKNTALHDLLEQITSNYLHLQQLYCDCQLSPSGPNALPQQMLHNLRVMADVYAGINPTQANSLEELGFQMGDVISTFTNNVTTVTLFEEMIKLYNTVEKPPTAE